MKIVNTSKAYGLAAIILHWVSAIGVIWLYFLGENIEHAKEDGLARTEIVQLVDFHSSVGAVFFLFLAARILSHVAQKQPAKPEQHRYLNMLSTVVMWLFLLMIGIQIISGPLIIWSGEEPLKVFDWLAIPTPFAERSDALHEALEFAHKTAPNLFWPLLVLHVGGRAQASLSRSRWFRRAHVLDQKLRELGSDNLTLCPQKIRN